MGPYKNRVGSNHDGVSAAPVGCRREHVSFAATEPLVLRCRGGRKAAAWALARG